MNTSIIQQDLIDNMLDCIITKNPRRSIEQTLRQHILGFHEVYLNIIKEAEIHAMRFKGTTTTYDLRRTLVLSNSVDQPDSEPCLLLLFKTGCSIIGFDGFVIRESKTIEAIKRSTGFLSSCITSLNNVDKVIVECV